MGGTTKLPGHVDSIASGIAERDRLTSPNLLTSINQHLTGSGSHNAFQSALHSISCRKEQHWSQDRQ
jgi:hypothetical protein